MQEIDTVVLSCDTEETWQHGNSLINYMKLVSHYNLQMKSYLTLTKLQFMNKVY